MPVLNADYLHNTNDNHDKVYNVQLEQNGTRYHVVAEYGRRLGVLKRITKYSGSSRLDATLEFNKLINEKVGKGYRRAVNARPVNVANAVAPTPLSVATKTKKSTKTEPTTKQPDTYNPNFIPERRFDDL
jgi:predicted DNA-binding WGR domain protein